MNSFNLQAWLKESKKAKTKDVSVTEKQLRDEVGEDKADINSITEKQLEPSRVDGDAKTTEQRLEKVRTGAAELTTEGELNKAGEKQRNEKTSAGNIPKLEEKRLSHSPVEEQKTKAIAETPIEARIEKMDSGKDGVKLAAKEKTAQLAEGSDIGDFDFSYGEGDDAAKRQRVQQMMDEPTGLASVTEDERDIDSALREFGLDEVDNIEEDPAWSEIQRDLQNDSDATGDMFREKSDVTEDVDTEERFLSGQLVFDADDPLVHSAKGNLNVKFIVEKAVGYLRAAHPDFTVTQDNLDLSQLDMGIVKFLATGATLGAE